MCTTLIVEQQLDFFTTFKSEYLNAPISLMTFQSLKPWWVQKLTTWNTYCYCYRQELKELLGDFNDTRTYGKGLHKTYNCTCSHVCIMVSNGEGSVLSSRCNAH